MNFAGWNYLRAAFVLLSLLSGSVAFAEGEGYLTIDQMPHGLRFGSEMTISNNELLQSYPKDGNQVVVTTTLAASYVQRIKQSIEQKYSLLPELAPTLSEVNFHSHWSRGAIKIEYPNGFNLTLFPDPGVLELNSKPSSIDELAENQQRIQTDFFDEGKKAGLEPALFTGSGHMHIEVSKLHPVTVRNFLADFYNATGLGAGALNEDIYNAIGSGELPETNKELLRKAFENFDASPEKDLKVLIRDIHKSYVVKYEDEPESYRKSRRGARALKYHAISYSSLFSLGTIEIRCLRPQANAEAYLKLAKLFTARMQLAEKNRLQGKLSKVGKMPSFIGKPQAVIANFDKYLREANFNLRDYKEFILPWWQFPGDEFDKYQLKRHNRGASCNRVQRM